MVSKRVIIKKLCLVLLCGFVLGFLAGRGIYHRPTVDYIVDPSYNALPSINLSEKELWNILKELENHVDYTMKVYNRLTAIESRVIKERIRE